MNTHEKIKCWKYNDCVEIMKSIGIKNGDYLINLGFTLSNRIENSGIHFEKYHSPHYIQKGGIDFEELERGTIYNFKKI